MSANYSQTVSTIAEAHLLGDSIGLNYNITHDNGTIQVVWDAHSLALILISRQMLNLGIRP